MVWRLAFWVVLTTAVTGGKLFVNGCYIHGSDIGYCEPSLYEDSEFRLAATPFCASYIKYSACVPKYDPLPASRDFPDGRWFNNTMGIKDAWIEQHYNEIVNYRLEVEDNKDLQKQGIDEYGNNGSPVPRFTDNTDCQKAFKAYMCYINFPRCDDNGNSLVTCRSACENLMVACQNQKDMWRCGESQYFNGYEAEEPETDSNGDPVYLRDFFPGQPFRDVEWASRRQPEIVCTPSIRGAAAPLLKPWGRRHYFNNRITAGIIRTGIGFGVVPVVAAIAGLVLASWPCWRNAIF
ncbi:unnamed protein product [Pylaiella littoralis]